jgi:hypothetical protein
VGKSDESLQLPHVTSLALIIGVWNHFDGALMVVSSAADAGLQEDFSLASSANRYFAALPAFGSWRSGGREIGVANDVDDMSSILAALYT